ncbi:MAG: hypothetical protein VYC34_06765 [Planctomycetota bacterium]|nr:hypothetical protein [Planctomycetota bacterium]
MKKSRAALATISIASFALLTACASHGVSGTWRASRADTPGPFKFGAVSFVQDGTYTAEMHYADEVLTNVGGWSTSGDRLSLSEPRRTYIYSLENGGDKLRITDMDTNTTVELDRYKPD